MIGFKSLIDYHLGATLTIVINSILEKYNLLDRVLLIIINNIYNNNTLIKELNSYINEAIKKRFLNGNITYIPCLTYIIQLALKALLGKIRLTPKNKTLVIV
jgi:hypothetical protein